MLCLEALGELLELLDVASRATSSNFQWCQPPTAFLDSQVRCSKPCLGLHIASSACVCPVFPFL